MADGFEEDGGMVEDCVAFPGFGIDWRTVHSLICFVFGQLVLGVFFSFLLVLVWLHRLAWWVGRSLVCISRMVSSHYFE